MHARYAALLALLLCGMAQASPLTDAVRTAARDAQQLGPAASRIRYLVLTGKNAQELEIEWRILSGHLNLLSRKPVISTPVVVLADGMMKGKQDPWTNARLLRIDLDHYGFSPKTWDDLGFSSPMFSTVLIQETVEVAVLSPRGDWIRWPSEPDWTPISSWFGPRTRRVVKKELGTAPWLVENAEDLANATFLVNATQARVPLVPADNFVWQTAIQANRKVGYYGFSGVKNRNDYFKLIGLDIKQSTDYSPELFAAVANSGVAKEPRRIIRYRTLGGGAWATHDSKQSIDQFNPLRFLNGGYKHNAEEWFGFLPNGMWTVFLSDDKGTRQDSAPDFIGFDHFAHDNDGRIHVGLSCWRCHSDGGLQGIKDSIRNTFSFPQVLQSPSLKELLNAQQHYFQRIEGKLTSDRSTHDDAMQEATGWKHAEWAKNYSTYFARYDRPVPAGRAAVELGLLEADFLVKLDQARKSPQGLDIVLSMYAVEPARRESVPRLQWNEAYNLAQLAIRGYVSWPQQR